MIKIRFNRNPYKSLHTKVDLLIFSNFITIVSSKSFIEDLKLSKRKHIQIEVWIFIGICQGTKLIHQNSQKMLV